MVQAEDGAESYNYSYWGLTTAAPAAYQANVLWNGESIGVGAFKEPSDFHVTEDIKSMCSIQAITGLSCWMISFSAYRRSVVCP